MNINLTDIEIDLIESALGAVWWQQGATDVPGQSEAHRVKRIQRKLARAIDHADTVTE